MRKRYLIVLLLSISAIAAQAQWTALSGPPGANVQDLERTTGGTMYLISNQKLFTSTNNGDSWAPVAVVSPANLSIDDIYIDGANKMYGLNYSQLYTSTDGGLNWTRVSSGQFYGMSNVQKFGPHGMLAIYGWNGLYVSTDDGVNWIKIYDTEVTSVVASTAGTLYIGARDSGIKRKPYPAGGLSGPWDMTGWTLAYSEPNDWGIKLLYDNTTNVIYATTYANSCKVLRATDAAPTTWTDIKGTISNCNVWGIWGKSPDGKIFLANAFSPYVYYATNPTSPTPNWTTISNSPQGTYGSSITRMVFQDANTIYLGTAGDAVFKTANALTTPASVTWTQKASGLNFGSGSQVEIASTGGRILYLNNESKGYWTSANGGSTWTFVPLADFVRRILKMADGTLLMYSYNGVYRSTDNTGNSFTKVSSAGFSKIIQSPGNGNLYANVGSTQIATSTDKGANWTYTVITTGMPASNWYFQEQFTVDNSDVYYGVVYDYNTNPAKNKFYKVTGTTGSEITGGPWISATDNDLSANSVFFSNSKLYLSEYNAIFESADAGVTWKTISFSGDYVFPITGGICVSRNGNPGSLYVTQDGGLSWNSTSLPSSGGYSYITDLAVDAAGDFIASAYNSPALKNTSDLVVDPATLPPFINFNWQPTNGPYGGPTRRLAKNGSNVYGLTSGDVYKTTTFSTWQNLSSSNVIYNEDMVYVPGSPSTIFGLTYSGLQTSIDDGVTWTSVNNETAVWGRNQIVRLANGKIAFYSYKDGGEIYVSGGATAPFTFGVPKYEIGATEGLDRLVATTDKIYISVYDNVQSKRKLYQLDNNGANLATITLPATLSGYYNVSVSADATTLYMWGDGKELYKSTNNGTTWTDMTGDLTQNISFWSKVYTSPTNELYILGDNNRLYKSINNGTNWTAVGTTALTSTLYDLIWSGTRMVLAMDEGIFTSDDGGVTRTLNSTGISGFYINDLYMAGSSRLFAGNYGRKFQSSDFMNWTNANPQFVDGFIDMPDGSILSYDCNDNYKSTDGGVTWTKQTNFTTCTENLVTPDGINFYDRRFAKLFYTNNIAGNWTELNISGLPAENQRNFTSHAVDGNGIGYIVLYNYQNSTYELYQILFGSAIKLSLSSGNPVNVQYYGGKIIIFYSNGTIFETTDGSTWTSKGGPSGDRLIIANNGYYFIPLYGGTLWLSRNQGGTWQSVGLATFSPDNTFTDLIVNESTGYAYGSISNSPVRKSGNIVIPDDLTPPSIVTLSPANNATNVSATANLTITFNEPIVPQAAKTLRIVDLSNPVVPVETINITAGVVSGKSITFDPATTLSYLKTYFVVFDNGSFKDIFGNTHAGIINNTTWRFTIQDVPDATAPSIAYTQANFTKGATNSLTITATDNAGGSGISAANVKLFYRKTMSGAAMTEVVIPNTSGSTFQITVPDTWLDELGLEFYFTAADVAGNSVRSPSGTSFYNAKITHTEANAPTIPTGFIGVGGKAGDYRMFSIPYDLQNGLVGSIFNELGAADKSLWRIVQYVNSSESYSDATSLTRGTGYWINTKTAPSAISVDGASTPGDTKTNEFKITLLPGWNLIGNPYPFTINWATVKAGNVAVGDAKSYNGSFITDNLLSPFEGAFVLLNGTQNAQITVPFAAKSSKMSNPLGSTFDGLWLLPLTIENGDMKNDMGGVGMHEQAERSLDQFDDVALPRLFDFPEIHFSHPENMMKNFTRDIVPVQEAFEWHFTADVKEGAEAVLSWNTDKLGNFDKDLYLLDESTQMLTNMLDQNHYSFLASKSATFKVFYGADLKSKIKPTSVMLGKPYPNPTQSNSSVSFTLPENATGKYNVVLDVYDMLGNKIITLANAELAPGFHTTAWSPEQQQISSGVYLYKLMVSDNTTKKILTEKLLIKK